MPELRDERSLGDLSLLPGQARHPDDGEIERYCIDAPRGPLRGSTGFNEAAAEVLEEHLLVCTACCERAEQIQDYVDSMTTAVVDRVLDQAWQANFSESLPP
jgi:hypothetical protein